MKNRRMFGLADVSNLNPSREARRPTVSTEYSHEIATSLFYDSEETIEVRGPRCKAGRIDHEDRRHRWVPALRY